MADYFLPRLGTLGIRWPNHHEPALRSAQIGSLLALAGHLATADEPGQAVVPTGVGKSAVISALPFFVPTRRVLVVVPSRLTRDQLAEEFAQLTTLRRLSVADESDELPKVRSVEHRIGSLAAWQDLEEFDVAIGTPGVLSSTYDGVASPPDDLFDLVIFDEAHHLPATTWKSVLSEHAGAAAALLTATPFRRDRKALPGRLVYHYGLSQAIHDGVYRPVEFVPVEWTDHEPDRSVAAVAIEHLRAAPHAAERSLLLVRTDRIEHARELVALYADLGCDLGIITSNSSRRQVRTVLTALANRQLEGVASVGALIEGFDLPALKIAAYHRPHRSLPATIQFVGRVARVTGGDAPAELVAMVGNVAAETAELYREDAAWAELLPQLSDAAVEGERLRREYVRELVTDDEQAVSPAALRPPKMVQVFDAGNVDIALAEPPAELGQATVIFRATDSDGRLAVAITERRVRPEWMATDGLDSMEYALFLAVHHPQSGLLFISAPTDTAALEFRDALGAEMAALASPRHLNRWLWGFDLVNYSSVGMRSARAVAARQASYRMVAGSAVESTLLPSESRSYAVGHLIARRQTGDTVTGVGISTKRSKIWESAATQSLLDFRNWCFGVGAAIADRGTDEGTAPRLLLAFPSALDVFPDHPIAVVLDHALIAGGTELRRPDGAYVDIGVVDITVHRVNEHRLRLTWALASSVVARTELDQNGDVRPVGDDPSVRRGARQLPLSELLLSYPSTVYFANGSSTQGATLVVPAAQLPALPPELVSVWDFTDSDIEVEKDLPDPTDRLSILSKTVAWAEANLDPVVVLIDDAAYEIADVIAIHGSDDWYEVHLFHCKKSGAPEPGSRLGDLYEVVGQAVRSARWSDSAAIWVELARRVEQRTATRVVRGNHAEARDSLLRLGEDPQLVHLTVWVVQPGLSEARINGWREGETLLMAAFEWCAQQGAALRAAISP